MSDGITLKSLSRKFGRSFALKNVSLHFPSKGVVGVLGHSGSGKTTLLNILSGLDVGFQGKAVVFGKQLRKWNERKRREFRLRNIGYVFQNFNLLELETAEMNVLLPMDALYADSMDLKMKKVMDLLTFFGISHKRKQKVNTLSGGEKQRVALARALASDPKILLCDEPTGALDSKNAEAVFSLLRAIGQERLVIVVSHDREQVYHYCDRIIELRDGQVAKCASGLETFRKSSAPKSLLLKSKRSQGKVSWWFLFRHGFHHILAKRWRSLISEAAISVGLSGLGLAVYISTAISGELIDAFSAMVPPSSIIMTPRGGNDSPVGAVYGASFEECSYAVDEYGDMVLDYGSDLHMDYESWFVDENYFYFYSGVERVRLTDFSARHINDFLWFDLESAPVCFPRIPVLLHEDQVVLGLPYANMFSTCLSLRIRRDYQSLGDYIDEKGWQIILRLRNDAFAFENEELFTVVAVMESEVPSIYHLDHRWNRKIFVDQMRFRTSLTEETPNPQYIFEIPFLSLRVPYSEFLYVARRDKKLEHLLYERANASYVPTQFWNDHKPRLPRLYLYGADKTGVSFSLLDEIMEAEPGIVGRNPITQGSYYAENGSLAMGFIGKFFVCKDHHAAEETVDIYSDLPQEAAFLPGEEISGTKDGSYFGAVSGGIRISSEIEGVQVPPTGPEECLMSQSLYEDWGKPSEVYIAAEIGAESIGRVYVREFSIAPLKVVGYKEAPQDTLFVASDWTVDFYIECLGMSSFVLEPSGAILYLMGDVDAKTLMDRLSKAYPMYAFSNPASDVADSVSSTLSYVGTILMAFSVIALLMSALLFFIVMAITMSENRAEERMLAVIGIQNRDVARSYYAHCVIYAASATLTSVALLAVSELLAKRYILSLFGGAFDWHIPLMPLAVVLIVGIGFSILIMLGIFVNLRKKDYSFC